MITENRKISYWMTNSSTTSPLTDGQAAASVLYEENVIIYDLTPMLS